MDRLPSEIISFIFSLALPYYHCTLSYAWKERQTNLKPIVLTCRQWRDIAFDTPQLWSLVKIETGFGLPVEGRVSRLLERSKGVPLDVQVLLTEREWMTEGSRDDPKPAEPVESAITLLKSKSMQWRTLLLTAGDFVSVKNVFRWVVPAELPALQEARVALLGSDSSSERFTETPNLSFLKVNGTFLLPHFGAANLRQLAVDITGTNHEAALTLLIDRIHEYCPDIEKLEVRLSQAVGSPQQIPWTSTEKWPRLSSLNALKLRFWNVYDTSAILCKLDSPVLETVDISGLSESPPFPRAREISPSYSFRGGHWDLGALKLLLSGFKSASRCIVEVDARTTHHWKSFVVSEHLDWFSRNTQFLLRE